MARPVRDIGLMPSLRAVLPAAAAGSVVLLAGILYCIGYRAQYYALAEAWGAAPGDREMVFHGRLTPVAMQSRFVVRTIVR